jgi:uncharacterized protein (TIGR03118 family)
MWFGRLRRDRTAGARGRDATPTRRSPRFGPRPVETLEDRALLSKGVHVMARPTRTSFVQTNLVSNRPNVAQLTDPDLLNSWGIADKPTDSAGPGGPFWVADNGAGVATLYRSGPISKLSLVVRVPTPPGSPSGMTSTPTGIVFNGTSGFVVPGTGRPASFLFVTEDGTIAAWNATLGTSGRVNAALVVDNSAKGAVYKGAAIASSNGSSFLYVTNFSDGTVEVYDTGFKLVNSFTDRRIPRGFAPFGIENINGVLFVTFAKQDSDKQDNLDGRGLGFVDAFDPSGQRLSRVASRGRLNAPWGLASAPSSFGSVAGDLLVGDFGDGRINAFRPTTTRSGALRFRPDGQLNGSNGRPIAIDGLWGLKFGNGGQAGSPDTLFFAAGPNDEKDGLFGSLELAPM